MWASLGAVGAGVVVAAAGVRPGCGPGGLLWSAECAAGLVFKGAGEAGNVGALPAVANALVDALSPLGIHHIEMPATPERLWRALRAAEDERG